MAALHGEGEEADEDNARQWEPWESPEVVIYDPCELRRAKQDELDRFAKMKVYEVIKREEATRKWGSKTIGVRWVIPQKSYGLKARLVAQEFASKKIDRDTLFAGTPSLGALRMIIARVAAEHAQGMMIMTGDISNVIIELPPEDRRSRSGEYVGHLRRAMYGTRDAPQQWQQHLARILTDSGCIESQLMPGVFKHGERNLEIIVHVDDLLVTGQRNQLQWLKDELSQRFDMNTMFLGPDRGDAKETQYLGRILRWTNEGITLEGDPSTLGAYEHLR